jgi:hypothetical protein
MGLDKNIIVDGKWEALSTTPTTHGRSFPGLCIATFNTGLKRIKKYKTKYKMLP